MTDTLTRSAYLLLAVLLWAIILPVLATGWLLDAVRNSSRHRS